MERSNRQPVIEMLAPYQELENKLAELRLILTVIAHQQDDKQLTVPVAAITGIPPNTELVISFDRAQDAYVFQARSPDQVDPAPAS